MTAFDAAATAAFESSRRAYERGRVRVGVVRGAVVAVGVTALAVVCCGTAAVWWAPLTWLVWALIEWRGTGLREGARRGVVAGAVTLILPATWLRACCEGMERGAACQAPATCALLGGVIGIALAAAMPSRGSSRRRIEAALGAAIAVLVVTAARCTLLLGGEALGLVAGLSAGLLGLSSARIWWGHAVSETGTGHGA